MLYDMKIDIINESVKDNIHHEQSTSKADVLTLLNKQYDKPEG